MPGARSKASATTKTLEEYLALPYRWEITPDEFGGFVLRYPDLLGCITQVENPDEIVPAAREILEAWLEVALEDGQEIPLPRAIDDYSGKFLVRTSKSLHRELVESAACEGVSLNAYVQEVLAAGRVWRETNHHFEEIRGGLDRVIDRIPVYTGLPGVPERYRASSQLDQDAYPVAA